MPRIIVTTDASEIPDDASILLYEEVRLVHLSTDHAAAQLLQRLAWAIGDADGAENARAQAREAAGALAPGVHASA